MICKKAAIVSLLLLFLVTGCTTNKLPENPPNTTTPSSNEKSKEEVHIRRTHPFDEQVKVPVNEAQGLTNVEIVKKLWNIYLDCYKKAPITEPDKLKDYKIVQVDEVKSQDSKHEIGFGITYSVLPCVRGAWTAGNGTRKADGWVVNKGMYVRLIKEGDLFKMEILGTGY